MTEIVKIIVGAKTYEFPIVEGTEKERAIDISTLQRETNLITLDPGFGNTASCRSAITYFDPDAGTMRYRGIPIEELIDHSSFREVAYLLINGVLPTTNEVQRFSDLLNEHSLVHEDMQNFFQHFPRDSHPMGILSAMVTALKSFYPYLENIEEEINITVTRLISKVRTLAAMAYKISRGHKVVFPRHDLSYCENFLNMMFDNPVRPYVIDRHIVHALSVFLILHADHEQSCSTTAIRVVGSARVNLYSAISAGIAALWGPLHGGVSPSVIEMIAKINEDGLTVPQIINRVKNPSDPFNLVGFGYRVYQSVDPRAHLMKQALDALIPHLKRKDPLLELGLELENAVLNDDYFKDNYLEPSLDFYSALILRAIGIPTNMFTVIFAIARMPGWIAQWKESMDDPSWKIARPRQVYVGPVKRKYIPIEKR